MLLGKMFDGTKCIYKLFSVFCTTKRGMVIYKDLFFWDPLYFTVITLIQQHFFNYITRTN